MDTPIVVDVWQLSLEGLKNADTSLFVCLSDTEKQFLRDRDYRGLIDQCGGNIYMIMKLGTCTGHGLYHVGAQLRGQTFEEFMATRNASGAR